MAGARGTIDAVPAGDAGGRSSGGLARILGWDRRPRAGSARQTRGQPPKDPSWERPRRYEAYPTLKTRVGMPIPSRLWLAAGAVLVAAAILFFVPPLFLKPSGGTGGPGATATPAGTGPGSGSGGPVASAGRSVGPTAKPTPKQTTYTIRQGDTLSTIAKRFKITVEELLAANKQIKDPNKIAIGDVLVIPTPAPSEIVSGESSASP
jgi:nucleoid-associated protein YgaU